MRVETVIDEIKRMEGVITRSKMDETRVSYEVSSYDAGIIRTIFDKYKDVLYNMEIKENK